MARTVGDYDDEALALDIADGTLTAAQIGERHGLTEGYVRQIMCGVRRPEILALVNAIAEARVKAACRRAAARLDGVFDELLKQAAKSGKTGDRRKAAELLLKHLAGDPSAPNVTVTQQQANVVSATDLDADLKAEYLKRHGGPCPSTPEQPEPLPDGRSDALPSATGESA